MIHLLLQGMESREEQGDDLQELGGAARHEGRVEMQCLQELVEAREDQRVEVAAAWGCVERHHGRHGEEQECI